MAKVSTASELRRQVESALAERIPSALTMRPAVLSELIPCGIAEVDAALGGGFPLGGITELTGTASSGCTTLMLSALAGITQRGGTCAYVDTSDSFDPLSGAALGIDLRRLLWVRPGRNALSARFPSPAPPTESTVQEMPMPVRGVWRHPRSEALGMDRAVGQLFQAQGHAQRQVNGSCEEACDLPDRASIYTPHSPELVRGEHAEPVMFMPQPRDTHPRRAGAQRAFQKKSWLPLDQALRATDLLLNAGGFRAIVLDMGDIPPEQAQRVPLATWYRFRLQAEKAQMMFLLLARTAYANSCAAVSLRFEEAKPEWRQAEENSSPLLAGLRYRISFARNRAVDPYRKKHAAPVQAAWSSTTLWSR